MAICDENRRMRHVIPASHLRQYSDPFRNNAARQSRFARVAIAALKQRHRHTATTPTRVGGASRSKPASRSISRWVNNAVLVEPDP